MKKILLILGLCAPFVSHANLPSFVPHGQLACTSDILFSGTITNITPNPCYYEKSLSSQCSYEEHLEFSFTIEVNEILAGKYWVIANSKYKSGDILESTSSVLFRDIKYIEKPGFILDKKNQFKKYDHPYRLSELDEKLKGKKLIFYFNKKILEFSPITEKEHLLKEILQERDNFCAETFTQNEKIFIKKNCEQINRTFNKADLKWTYGAARLIDNQLFLDIKYDIKDGIPTNFRFINGDPAGLWEQNVSNWIKNQPIPKAISAQDCSYKIKFKANW